LQITNKTNATNSTFVFCPVCDRPRRSAAKIPVFFMNLKELTYQINGAVYEVNKVLGAGFLEKVYENALLVELRKGGLKAEAQAPINVKYKDEVVGDYFADIVVEGQVVLEIKAVESLSRVHEAQLLNYLRATGITIGLLINFKHSKADIRRMVWKAED
jgi:GxxExxY protein